MFECNKGNALVGQCAYLVTLFLDRYLIALITLTVHALRASS